MLSRHPILRDARDAIDLADSGLGARIPGEPLIACLVFAVVDPGANHGPRRHDHEEEANDHISNGHNIVNVQIVATDTQGPIVARRVVVDMLVVAVRDADRRH